MVEAHSFDPVYWNYHNAENGYSFLLFLHATEHGTGSGVFIPDDADDRPTSILHSHRSGKWMRRRPPSEFKSEIKASVAQ